MLDLSDQLTGKERREIAAIAEREAEALGVSAPSVEDMALALLRAHLVLIRDCGGILPARSGHLGAFKSRRGVSLGAGKC